MLSSGISFYPLRCRHGLAVLLSLLACGCFTDPKIDSTQTRHCKDDKSCPWGSICGTNGICCESADGKTCKGVPPSGGPDAPAIDTFQNTSYDVGYDISIRETGTGGAPGLDGSIDMGTDLPIPGPDAGTGGIPGTGGMPGTGGSGVIDAPGLDTVDAPLTEAGGIPGTGGAGGTKGSGGGGGFTGGAPGSGGVVGTGGITATGGMVGTGGTTSCQPKARDCTSSLDNDCNGTPDNQETAYCACPVSQARTCQEHPGYDGVGICKAGSQSCAASSDKTLSSWGACTGSVGPGTRNCTSSVDNDCNGTPDSQETAYCQCPATTTQSCLPPSMCTPGSQTCSASSDKTTTSWGPCAGYTSPSIMYRDSDGDGYGDPLNSNQVCPGTLGYVSNNEDCDDANSNFKPGVSICGTVTQKKTCTSGSHGVASTQTCDQGCINGNCRTDGTIGLPGYVSCTSSHTPRCLTGDGCEHDDDLGTCGTAGSAYHLYCDGPNDCPGQKCWLYSIPGSTESKCYSSQPETYYYEVCDPLASTCNCVLFSTYWPIYACM